MMLPSDCVRAVGLVRDLVAGEEEAQRDEQTTGGDERDHVADAGEQDLPGAGAPADAAGGRDCSTARTGAGTLDPGGIRIVRGGNGFGDHLGGLVDRALDAGCDDRLAREAALVLDADVGGEDDGVGAGDGRRGAAGCCPTSPASRRAASTPASLAAATSESAAM